MNALRQVFGGARIGLVLDGHHLVYGASHGRLLWAPDWLKPVIVKVWNFVACYTLGHDTIGPWDEPPDEDGRTIHVDGCPPGHYPKTCCACGRVWREAKP